MTIQQPPKAPGLRILHANWTEHRETLSAIRLEVFVREQGVPEELEWDGADAQAIHLLAQVDPHATPVGTARLLPTGQIGRMAVLPDWRGRGIGTALLHELLNVVAQGRHPQPFLNAQVSALPFYLRAGFGPVGPVFDEAGIAHQRMELKPREAPPMELTASERILHRDPGMLSLEGPAAIRAVGARMASQARRELCILSRDLDPYLYDNLEFIAAVRRLAIQGHDLPVRILLWDALAMVRNGHRLLPLVQQLTSRIAVRCLGEAQHARIDAYLLADVTGYIHRPEADIHRANADFHAPSEALRLRKDFQTLWDEAEPCRELRRLCV